MSLRRTIILIALVFAFGCTYGVSAQDTSQDTSMTTSQIHDVLERIDMDDDVIYYIRLTSGDILTGPIREISSDSSGTSLRIYSQIGKARVYIREIKYVGTYTAAYRQKHRTYIMPTAAPIGKDHFIGVWELAFLYAGAGISDFLSITAGRSVIPSVPGDQQVNVVNIKATLHQAPNGLLEEGMQYYAAGVNGTWLNDVNFLGHLYAVATFTGRRTSVSTMLFAKIVGKDDYIVSAGTLFNQFRFPYANGAIGVGLSLDSRMEHFHDMHFLAEVWTADITRPAGTALFVGVRINNTSFSSDFGITVANGPLILPTVSVAWTPFKY